MRFIPGTAAGRRAAIFLCAITIVFLLTPALEARPVRHRRATPFSVALEPFVLARSVVHAAAAPIVHNAPRILAATAVAPIKVAYYAPRRLKPRPPRGSEELYEADEESDVKPIRVAYSASGPTKTVAPRAEEYDQDQEQEQEKNTTCPAES